MELLYNKYLTDILRNCVVQGWSTVCWAAVACVNLEQEKKLKCGAELDFISSPEYCCQPRHGFFRVWNIHLPFRTGWQIKQGCAANPVGGCCEVEAPSWESIRIITDLAIGVHWTHSVVCFLYLHSSLPQERQCTYCHSEFSWCFTEYYYTRRSLSTRRVQCLNCILATREWSGQCIHGPYC